jgi:GAF domain-containing protein
MMAERPRSHQMVAHAFVTLAEAAVVGGDVGRTLLELCQRCVALFDITTARAVLLDDKAQVAQSAAAPLESLPAAELMEDCPDGPYQQCLRTGQRGSVADLALVRDSTAMKFVAHARRHGIASAHALPMHSCGVNHGILALLSTAPDTVTTDDTDLAQALADAAAAGIGQQRALHRTHTLAKQLQQALDSRVIIEQAKGALGHYAGTTPDQAFTALRDYARAHNQPLHELARQILSDDTLAQRILGE